MPWTKEYRKEYLRQYHIKHKQKAIERAREWAKNNPERRRQISLKYEWKKTKSTAKTRAKSATWRGRRMEKLALKFFQGAIDMNEYRMGASYDIQWNGLRIDVKSRNFYIKRIDRENGRTCGQWTFNKGKNDADYYFCICKKNDKPIKFYLIPAKEFGKGICMGIDTKFEAFRIKNYVMLSSLL